VGVSRSEFNAVLRVDFEPVGGDEGALENKLLGIGAEVGVVVLVVEKQGGEEAQK